MTRVCAVALWAAVAIAHEPAGVRSQAGFGAGALPVGTAFPSLDKVVKPVYPDDALRTAIQGEVHLEAVVDATGAVTDARIVKSLDKDSGLDDSALAAVRKWKFKPATVQGKKVAAVAALRVTFYLQQPGKRDGKPFVDVGVRSLDDLQFDNVPNADEPGITAPTLVRQVQPQYTSEAMRQKIQGRVMLEAVVGVDGRVTAARVLRSLDKTFGLDQQALAAARQWRFTPAHRNGAPVAVRVMFDLDFRLQ